MAETRARLTAVDRLEITILVDNSIDIFLSSTEEVRRTRLPSELPWGDLKALVAEHGYSALVSVHSAGHSATLLFDTGISTQGLIHNTGALEMRPNALRSIVRTNGHLDTTQAVLVLI